MAGNIAWEFTWGLVYRTDLGEVFVWGYRLWFLLDVFIVWGLLRYGVRHIATPKLREYFRFAVVSAILAFAAALYLLVRQGYDTSTGLVSGYMATLMMSALYIPQFFRENDLGSIQAGRFADLVVTDRDYLTVPADQIKDLKSVLTMVGGRVVYDAANDTSTGTR